MKRPVSLLLITVMVGTCFGFAPPAEAQADRAAICATAQATGSYGRYNVVLGTDGDDVLRGGSGNDLICGFGGDDRLVGGSGNDVLVGGPGADDLRGGSGNDELHVDDADTRVKGGSGNNKVIAAPIAVGVVSFIFTVSTSTRCTVGIQYSGFPPFTQVDADLYYRDGTVHFNDLFRSVDADLDGGGNGSLNLLLESRKNIDQFRVLGPGIDSGWVMTSC